MPISGLVSTADVAKQLGVHVRTVHRMVATGRLTPLIKAPGKKGAYLFDPDQLARDLDGREPDNEVAS